MATLLAKVDPGHPTLAATADGAGSAGSAGHGLKSKSWPAFTSRRSRRCAEVDGATVWTNRKIDANVEKSPPDPGKDLVGVGWVTRRAYEN